MNLAPTGPFTVTRYVPEVTVDAVVSTGRPHRLATRVPDRLVTFTLSRAAPRKSMRVVNGPASDAKR